MNTKKDQRWAIPPGPSPEDATRTERRPRKEGDTDPAASRRRARTDPERPDLGELAQQVAPSAIQTRSGDASPTTGGTPGVGTQSPMRSFTGEGFSGQTIPADGPDALGGFSSAPVHAAPFEAARLEPDGRSLGFFQSGGLSSPSREAVTAPPEASLTLASPADELSAGDALAGGALPAGIVPSGSIPIPAGSIPAGDEEGRPTIVERSRPTSLLAAEGGETLPSPPWGEGED